MPKTFPIRLEVEEIALGPVLRKLNDMPGIVDLHLDLGHGGQGAGRKQLEEASAAKANRGTNEQVIVKMLMKGPAHLTDLTREIGGKKSSAYTVLSKMKKQGLVTPGDSKGTYQLTQQAKTQLGVTPALPAPAKTSKAKIEHGPSGRAAPGSGNIVLRTVLADGAAKPANELRQLMGGHGMSAKSISGVLDRARKGGLIKKNGNGYELTAAGRKIEIPEASAHG